MREEPMEKEEMSEDDTPRRSLADRVQDATKTLRERFSNGGVFVFAILFAVGALFGVAAKAVAARSILIGYWDYTVSPRDKAAINLNAVQKELLVQQEEETRKQEDAAKAAEDSAGSDGSESELPPLPPPPSAPPEAPQGN